ncbi:MAG: UTP--glucose-1-phosphate uridylyltransferase [candidate division WS6 bacterium OLB20]|uniref:UTP--glucose-1-phosphate uridylyltransferase n=1 Tax=candidate division WS6 bacterium OLB20 TaxID=1617426 RepID=A0A136M0B8_9BACT|nr:MAG: UTP--glucose-1-phosphate uridylyltransferase [candidate division WS6 bacterium OLB20]
MSRKHSVRTAIIPAGGFGTRFLPATKSIPKEMFPVGGKPVILHVVEEAVAAGIEHVIFITSPQKHAVEDFFSSNQLLEDYLLGRGMMETVGRLKEIQGLAHYSYVHTQVPYGNGGALLAAEELIDDEPFIVLWGDEIVLTKGPTRAELCIETFEAHDLPVISALRIADPGRHQKYGMAELKDFEQDGSGNVKQISRITEKPDPGSSPSEYATHGAYVLDSDFMNVLKHTYLGKNGELWLSDALNNLISSKQVLARILPDALYLDCGNPEDYLASQLMYAEHIKEISE